MRIVSFVKRITSSDFLVARPQRAGSGVASSSIDTRANTGALPPEIAFLTSYGVPPAQLIAATRLAHQQGVSADRALLANGLVEERYFYRCLARHLGVPFLEEPVPLIDLGKAYAKTIHGGLVPFKGANGRCWLGAPRGPSILTLLRNARRGIGVRSTLVITTPSNLSRWIQQRMQRRIAADASFDLLSADAKLSARAGANTFQKCVACIVMFVFAASFAMPSLAEPRIWLIGLMFLAAVSFRLFVSSIALGVTPGQSKRLADHELPAYTILVALYKEARIVKQLIRRLDRIDYPRAKLEIKLVIEADDLETRLALEALPLTPIYEVVIAPEGDPRTKPRALNMALPLARGELVVVFDAEDEPDHQQLRRAAERFASSPSTLACLQARLAIDNVDESWLTRFFAIEYAALFELQNAGLAALHLPIPVSGSSNHFRTSVLREIHGWDAWNVTEDADIGLRLARKGYGVDVLDATTYEEAPLLFKAWLGQRQRWYKGWLQTFITVTRAPFTLTNELGIIRCGGLALFLIGLLLGPLFWIPANIVLIISLAQNGFSAPANLAGICLTTLWVSAGLCGAASIFWYAFMGMSRRGLLHLWPVLPLLPIYYCLHTLAAWRAVFELFDNPFHWQKTEHGLTHKNKPAFRMPILNRLPR